MIFDVMTQIPNQIVDFFVQVFRCGAGVFGKGIYLVLKCVEVLIIVSRIGLLL